MAKTRKLEVLDFFLKKGTKTPNPLIKKKKKQLKRKKTKSCGTKTPNPLVKTKKKKGYRADSCLQRGAYDGQKNTPKQG